MSVKPLDDLKNGDWLFLILEEEEEVVMTMFGPQQRGGNKYTAVEIITVQLPMIFAKELGSPYSRLYNLNNYKWQICTQEMIKAFNSAYEREL